MIRQIWAIVLGYAFFAIASLTYFQLLGRNPHAAPSYPLMMVTAGYGVLVSLIAGVITRSLTKNKSSLAVRWLCAIMAAFATFSYFKSDGNHWTQLLAIFVFAPSAFVGGLLYERSIRSSPQKHQEHKDDAAL
ncbi:MAG: hypothetical protein REI78_03445 [Pedobacter sp.]|nr:hypothetical protein [Pedobacter sp.]MDQ8052049.1 hypothetical protein [Pedobacter sp.]